MSVQILRVRNSKHADKGFTIVEIIVVMAILGISVIGLVAFVQLIQNTQKNIYYMNLANEAARTKITELQNKDFSTITNGTITFTSDDSLDGLPSDHSAQAVITTPTLAPASKQVDVTIRYNVGSLNKYVAISAYINPEKS